MRAYIDAVVVALLGGALGQAGAHPALEQGSGCLAAHLVNSVLPPGAADVCIQELAVVAALSDWTGGGPGSSAQGTPAGGGAEGGHRRVVPGQRPNSTCSMSVKRTCSSCPARRPPSWKYMSLSPSAAISRRRCSVAPCSWASKRRAA